jgi:hypothetical protein
MSSRLAYAAIGLLFGGVLAVVLWWLYGLGLSVSWGHADRSLTPHLQPWLIYVGGGCAVAGFILKERVGDLVGSALRFVYDAETLGEGSSNVPGWLVALVLLGVAALVWYFVA